MADRNDPTRRVWECSACNGINVWNWQDAERAASLLKLENPEFSFANNRNTGEIHIAHGSCFDHVCGCCGANHVAADSPILAECYTHVAADPSDPDNYEWEE